MISNYITNRGTNYRLCDTIESKTDNPRYCRGIVKCSTEPFPERCSEPDFQHAKSMRILRAICYRCACNSMCTMKCHKECLHMINHRYVLETFRLRMIQWTLDFLHRNMKQQYNMKHQSNLIQDREIHENVTVCSIRWFIFLLDLSDSGLHKK